MPITVIPFLPTQVGPGTSFFIQTDLIAPIGLDWTYFALVFPVSGDQEAATAYWSLQSQGLHSVVLENYQGQFSNIQGTNLQQGEPCVVQFQLLNAQGAVEDESDRFPMTWDGSGALARWIQHQRAAGSVGLTPEEHTWLDTTQAAVQQQFQTLTGLALESPIGGLLAHPDTHLMNIYNGCTVITGSGALQLPSAEPAFDSYGVIVTFDSVPPCFGFRQGVSPKYFERIVQLAAVYATNDGQHQYLGEVQDFYTDRQLWLWREFRPLELLYNVTPGCQVSICFLTT